MGNGGNCIPGTGTARANHTRGRHCKRTPTTLLGDKDYAGRAFAAAVGERDATLVHPRP